MWISLGRYMPLEHELDRLAAVTLKDLRDIHEAFPMTPVTIGRLPQVG
jgi:hypothetical protein